MTGRRAARVRLAMLGLVAVAAAALVPTAAGAVAAVAPRAVPAAETGAFSGFGATLAVWTKAHPEDSTACSTSPCYGPVVASLPPVPEFSGITTLRGRVVGYTQALRRGTPLLQAELQVAELFPADVTMSSQVTVVKRDQFGSSCAVYDLHSATLERLFGKQAFGNDGGNIGVELATLTPRGATTYNPRSIDLAVVIPYWADKSINC